MEDKLIQRAAKHIKRSISFGVCWYRLGGDEFVVVLENIHCVVEPEEVADSFTQNVSSAYSVAKMGMMITVSIGIASYPQREKDVGNLLKKADTVTYRTESTAHNMYCVYKN